MVLKKFSNNRCKGLPYVYTRGMTSTTDFIKNQTYEMTFASNSEAVSYFTVAKRTAKFVTLEDSDGKQTRVGIHVRNNAEFCMPFGRYSMAPVLCATRSLEAEVV